MIGLSALISFGLFVNNAGSVNKHFDYIFYCVCYALKLWECIIAAATASSSIFSAMSVFGVENRRRFLRSKTSAGFGPRVSTALGRGCDSSMPARRYLRDSRTGGEHQ